MRSQGSGARATSGEARGLRRVVAGCILATAALSSPARPGLPQSGLGASIPAPLAQDSSRSTRSGAYSAPQARSGREVYILNCVSCHTPVSHTGPAFVEKWEGRTLWELFRYVSESMPKSEPGSLSTWEYSRVVAYLLQMNGAPAGTVDLLPDSIALKQVLIELKPR